MKPKHQRLFLIMGLLAGLGIAAFLTLIAFQDNMIFFYTPSDLEQKKIHPKQRIRVGGIVQSGSVYRKEDFASFKITDQIKTINVAYQGLLPDLFREGQGVVIEGHLLTPTQFRAETVLAKHDEKYMPPEVANQIKKTGYWRNDK